MGYFHGKKVIITGGSAGIGQSTAVLLAEQGAHVAILARGQERLDETVALLSKKAASPDQRFLPVSVDVTDSKAVKEACSQAISELGGLDAVICNSGYAKVQRVLEMTDEDVMGLMNVNYLGHIHTVKATAPTLVDQGHGDICLVSSVLALFSVWGYGPYSASKYAIRGLSEALYFEMKPHGVRVTQFFPSTTDTPGLESENADKDPVSWAMESGSLNNTLKPEQVAAAILRSIERGSFENTIGFDSWLMRFGYQIAPGLARWVAGTETDKARKKVESDDKS